jgi:hypothetical protein
MRLAATITAVVALILGCKDVREAPHPPPSSPAEAAASASRAAEARSPPSHVAPASPAPFAGLELFLEPSNQTAGGLPARLKLVARNSGDRAVRFTTPGPLCPAIDEDADRKIRYPLLGVVFWDAEGREGDTSFGPLLADLEARAAPAPEEVSLAPGGTWSREFPAASFSFFGPCGPATNVEQLFRPGDVELTLALELIELPQAVREDELPSAEEAPPTPVRRRSNTLSAPLPLRRCRL